jgi:hypothetical protein
MKHDQFTKLKGTVSRQRIYQLRHAAAGLCQLCSKPRVTATYCLRHAVKSRNRQRQKNGAERTSNCLTRRLEKTNQRET